MKVNFSLHVYCFLPLQTCIVPAGFMLVSLSGDGTLQLSITI